MIIFSAHDNAICPISKICMLLQMDAKMNDIFNSLRPSDAIWRQRSGSTLAQVMACCLTAPSHYLHQCWLIISKVLWHSSEGNFIRETSATTGLKITFPKLNWNLPGATELTIMFAVCPICIQDSSFKMSSGSPDFQILHRAWQCTCLPCSAQNFKLIGLLNPLQRTNYTLYL